MSRLGKCVLKIPIPKNLTYLYDLHGIKCCLSFAFEVSSWLFFIIYIESVFVFGETSFSFGNPVRRTVPVAFQKALLCSSSIKLTAVNK